MIKIKPDVTQQRCQLLGTHEQEVKAGGMKEGDDLPGTTQGEVIKSVASKEIQQPGPSESKRRLSFTEKRKLSIAISSPIFFENQQPQTKIINGINTAVFPDSRQFPIYDAIFFHGSGSASLLAFTDFMPAGTKGKLLPMGVLKKQGLFPFCGERGNALWTHSAANKKLSVTTLPDIDASLDYAKGDGWFSPQARKDLDTTQKSLQFFHTEQPESDNQLFRQLQKQRDLLEGQLFQFQRLSEEQKYLVNEGFPVLYGIHEPSTNQAQKISSDIPGEMGIPGGVEGQDIEVIYVPENKIPLIKALLEESHLAVDHIKLEKIEPLLSFRSRLQTFP